MPTISETAYPRLKDNLTSQELSEIYTPTPEELAFAEENSRSRVAKVGLLIVLKTFQRLGYSVSISTVPVAIIQHIVRCSQLTVSSTDLEGYDPSGTHWRHISLIREYLGLKAWGPTAKQEMRKALESAAVTMHDLADMINVAIEELIRQRFELPRFSSMVKAARRARHTITEAYHQKILNDLSTKERIQLDGLFLVKSESGTTLWNDLKQEPGRPMLSHLKDLVERLNWLSQLRLANNPLVEIPEVKIKHFAEEAQTLEASQMKELRPDKRYGLATSLISEQYGQTLDDLAQMFIKRMQNLHHRAKDALAEYRQAIQQKLDVLISTLRDLMAAYIGKENIQERLEAIDEVVGEQGTELLEECESYLAYAGNNYLPFLSQFYRSHRATLFRFLEAVPLHSSTQDKTLEAPFALSKPIATAASLCWKTSTQLITSR